MRKPISIRLKEASLKSVDDFAISRGWSRTEALERLIDEALGHRGLLIGKRSDDTWKAGDEHYRHIRPTLGNYDDDT